MLRATVLPFIAMATLGSAMRRTLVGDMDSLGVLGPYLSLNDTCQKIASSISTASQVYYFPSLNYLEDISHWSSSCNQTSACSFEPGTPEDVGIALHILGQTKTPFAVKGGGHSPNPGFSSTVGVQIAMTRFSDVVYNSSAETVTFGSGLVWDDVYTALDPHGVNVVGGRVSGVGVAGLTLGGGYSWLTNQYGLTIDNVLAYELVMPNGTVINVTDASSPDLFFALKGGLNNFGIVTRFTLKTFPQSQVWGGVVTFPTAPLLLGVLDKITLATANFTANNTDPKAAIIASYSYILGLPQPTVIIFYDGPTPPPGLFDAFLAIPTSINDISTRSFSSFVQGIPEYPPRLPLPLPLLKQQNDPLNRAIFDSISVTTYTHTLLQSIANEASYLAESLALKSVAFINYDVETFLPTLFSHNTTPTAYPPDRTRGLLPLEIFYSWELPEFDQDIYDAMRNSTQKLLAQAIAEGLSDDNAAIYPNYAIFDTPLVKLYGANVPRLQAIKKAIDPVNVMGLTGGFMF